MSILALLISAAAASTQGTQTCSSPFQLETELDKRLIATTFEKGSSRKVMEAQLGAPLADHEMTDAGRRLVQWLIEAEAGSRTGVVSLHCTFREGQLEACEPVGRFHVQRVSQGQLDRLRKDSSLTDVFRALCTPEYLQYVPETDSLLARYTLPLPAGALHATAFVELWFDKHGRLKRTDVSQR